MSSSDGGLPEAAPPDADKRTVGKVAGALGLLALDYITFGAVESIAGLRKAWSVDQPHAPDPVVPENMGLTSAPVRTIKGEVLCSACLRPVPFETMTIDEHGYFCSNCKKPKLA